MVSSSSRKVYVITGASRGLGLGLVTGLLKQPDTIIVAAARNPDKAEPLQKLAKEYGDRLHTVSLDTSNEESVKVWQLLSCCLRGGIESHRARRMHIACVKQRGVKQLNREVRQWSCVCALELACNCVLFYALSLCSNCYICSSRRAHAAVLLCQVSLGTPRRA